MHDHAIGFAAGAGALVRGLRHIAGHRETWPWVLGPALLLAVMLCGAVGGGVAWGPAALRAIWPDVSDQPAVLRGLLLLVADGALIATLAIVAWSLTSALAGPFHDQLSALIEARLGARLPDAPAGPAAMLGEVASSAAHSLLALCAWLAASCALLPVQLLPGVGQVIWVVGTTWISAVMIAWQVLDYPLSRRRLSFRAKASWIRAHLAATSGLGVATLAMLTVPFVDLLAPAAAVAGATLLVVASAPGEGDPERR